MRRSERDILVAEKFFEVSHPTLEVVDICARDLSFGDGIESDAFDAGFLA